MEAESLVEYQRLIGIDWKGPLEVIKSNIILKAQLLPKLDERRQVLWVFYVSNFFSPSCPVWTSQDIVCHYNLLYCVWLEDRWFFLVQEGVNSHWHSLHLHSTSSIYWTLNLFPKWAATSLRAFLLLPAVFSFSSAESFCLLTVLGQPCPCWLHLWAVDDMSSLCRCSVKILPNSYLSFLIKWSPRISSCISPHLTVVTLSDHTSYR